MKILIGDGKKLLVRNVGEIIYQMDAKKNLMIPLHGYKIMTDDEARKFIEECKHLSCNKNLMT